MELPGLHVFQRRRVQPARPLAIENGAGGAHSESSQALGGPGDLVPAPRAAGPHKAEGGAGADADSLEQHLRGGRKRAATEDVEVRKRPAAKRKPEAEGGAKGAPENAEARAEGELWGAATDPRGRPARARAIASTRMCPCMAH